MNKIYLFLFVCFLILLLLDQKYPLKGGVGICEKSKLVNKYTNNKLANKLEIEKQTTSPADKKLNELFSKIPGSGISIENLRNDTEQNLNSRINLYFNNRIRTTSAALDDLRARDSRANSKLAEYSGGQYTLCVNDLLSDNGGDTKNLNQQKYNELLQINERKKKSGSLLTKLNKLEDNIYEKFRRIESEEKLKDTLLKKVIAKEKLLNSTRKTFIRELIESSNNMVGLGSAQGILPSHLNKSEIKGNEYRIFMNSSRWKDPKSKDKIIKFYKYMFGLVPLLGWWKNSTKVDTGVIMKKALKYKEVKNMSINGKSEKVLVFSYDSIRSASEPGGRSIYNYNTKFGAQATKNDVNYLKYSAFKAQSNISSRRFMFRLNHYGGLPGQFRFFTSGSYMGTKHIQIHNTIIKLSAFSHPTITPSLIDGYYELVYIVKEDGTGIYTIYNI